MHQFIEEIIIMLTKHGFNIIESICHVIIAVFARIRAVLLAVSQYIKNAVISISQSDWLTVRNRLIQYGYLVRLDKPVGIILLLWPALWALCIAAEGIPSFDVLIIFVSGVIIMRSAGCIMNDIADRDFDRHISRTRTRPITDGKIEPAEALCLVFALLLCALILALNLNDFAFKLSFIALLLAVIYPFMKRFTYLPQLFLGLAFSWSVPMAFAAQNSYIDTSAWLLFMMSVLWVVVYDTMYAMVDREEDIRIGLKSTAILFDDADCIIIGVLQLIILLTQILIGYQLDLGMYYYIGIAFASLFFIYQQYLIKDRIPQNCLRAFLNNQWYGMAVFIGLYMDYILR